MKLVKKFLCAVLFVSALSVSASAGDMETPGYVAPPPSTSQIAANDQTAGTPCVSSQPCENTASPSDELLYAALKSLISLF
ncbi:MAG TPA: hypothetical protein VJ372_09315 [Pyrinomonadaceae bacterium]|jgi:hypothetical protein|nr:hypothetical protein [Pyrinomonadaceae bacterium]